MDRADNYFQSESWKSEKPLKGKISVVTGAAREAGKAIACVLGEAGSTVYVTGRTSRSHPGSVDYPWTIEDAAEEVTRRGGKGIPFHCDHTRDGDVIQLFEKVKAEQGHLHILVNNAWGGYMPYPEHNTWFGHSLLEQSMDKWEGMFTAGVRAHLVTNMYGIPLMLNNGGVVVSTGYWDRWEYLILLFYDMAKCAINRMAFGLDKEFHEKGIAAVSISPGWMRVERTYKDVPQDKLDAIESPEYLGRVILALAMDRNRMTKSGKTWEAGELARIYGVRDIDGRQHDYHSEIRDPKNILFEP